MTFTIDPVITVVEFRQRRQALGSQRNVARVLGLSRHTLSRWENSSTGALSWHPQIVRLALESLEQRHATYVPPIPDVAAVLARGQALAAGA